MGRERQGLPERSAGSGAGRPGPTARLPPLLGGRRLQADEGVAGRPRGAAEGQGEAPALLGAPRAGEGRHSRALRLLLQHRLQEGVWPDGARQVVPGVGLPARLRPVPAPLQDVRAPDGLPRVRGAGRVRVDVPRCGERIEGGHEGAAEAEEGQSQREGGRESARRARLPGRLDEGQNGPGQAPRWHVPRGPELPGARPSPDSRVGSARVPLKPQRGHGDSAADETVGRLHVRVRSGVSPGRVRVALQERAQRHTRRPQQLDGAPVPARRLRVPVLQQEALPARREPHDHVQRGH